MGALGNEDLKKEGSLCIRMLCFMKKERIMEQYDDGEMWLEDNSYYHLIVVW